MMASAPALGGVILVSRNSLIVSEQPALSWPAPGAVRFVIELIDQAGQLRSFGKRSPAGLRRRWPCVSKTPLDEAPDCFGPRSCLIFCSPSFNFFD
jgi:hypothetical protein